MTRAFQIGGLLLLFAASGISDQKGSGKPPKAAPPPRAEAARPNNPKANGEFKNGAPRLPNPLGNPVQRLMAMPPEQRERVLEKYPPQQQANLRQRLDEFDKLPPAEKARRLQLLQSFSNLPPEKQQILARQLPAFNALPDDRRIVLRKELVQLWRMPESERQARLNSEAFKSQFSPSELQMLSDISQNYPFPGK
ncbi:MAG TPA: DUF3106 domain-containing protein [Candidatus Acidoferrales bacterium]|nr:DUF3106 domain-containing protein [Candidatus Acidoferrales bacterium]